MPEDLPTPDTSVKKLESIRSQSVTFIGKGTSDERKICFEALVTLCRETHEVMRLRAARSVNIELVVRN